MYQNGETHFKNLAVNAHFKDLAANDARFLKYVDHFRTLCIKRLNQIDSNLTKTILFGDLRNNTTLNTLIINAIIDFVLDSKRFDVSFF